MTHLEDFTFKKWMQEILLEQALIFERSWDFEIASIKDFQLSGSYVYLSQFDNSCLVNFRRINCYARNRLEH